MIYRMTHICEMAKPPILRLFNILQCALDRNRGSGWSQSYGTVSSQSQSTLSGSSLSGITFGNEGRSGANEGDASYDFWAGGGGGGAGARGENPTKTSGGIATEVTSFANADRTVARGGNGGVGKSPTWLSASAANTLGVGHVSGSSVYFAGGVRLS